MTSPSESGDFVRASEIASTALRAAKLVGIDVRRQVPRVGRYYDLPHGRSYPSVTTILSAIGKPALVNWAANVERDMVLAAAGSLYLDLIHTPPMSMEAYIRSLKDRLGHEKAHQKELQKGQEVGSQAHHYIDWLTRKSLGQVVGPAPEVTTQAQSAIASWVAWRVSVHLEPIHVEQVVWSDKYEYAGTVDLVARVNGELTLVDYKTGKRVYPEAQLQVAAYAEALAEMGHEDCRRLLIVRLPKTTQDEPFEVVEVPPRETLLPVFLALRTVWAWMQDGQGQ